MRYTNNDVSGISNVKKICMESNQKCAFQITYVPVVFFTDLT